MQTANFKYMYNTLLMVIWDLVNLIILAKRYIISDHITVAVK
jgi:hypothetical protein